MNKRVLNDGRSSPSLSQTILHDSFESEPQVAQPSQETECLGCPAEEAKSRKTSKSSYQKKFKRETDVRVSLPKRQVSKPRRPPSPSSRKVRRLTAKRQQNTPSSYYTSFKEKHLQKQQSLRRQENSRKERRDNELKRRARLTQNIESQRQQSEKLKQDRKLQFKGYKAPLKQPQAPENTDAPLSSTQRRMAYDSKIAKKRHPHTDHKVRAKSAPKPICYKVKKSHSAQRVKQETNQEASEALNKVEDTAYNMDSLFEGASYILKKYIGVDGS